MTATACAGDASPPVIAGVILVGGRSQRMGGRAKGLLPLARKPLLGHVVDRLRPQVSCLALSVECEADKWQRFGLPQLPDPWPGSQGPLGGLLAGLTFIQGRADWLLLVPCDAPFLPLDLGVRLLACAGTSAIPGAVVRCDGMLQPTFSLWHASLLPALERVVELDGKASLRRVLRRVPLAQLEWPDPSAGEEPPPFYNINDPVSLERARRWRRQADAAALQCSA